MIKLVINEEGKLKFLPVLIMSLIIYFMIIVVTMILSPRALLYIAVGVPAGLYGLQLFFKKNPELFLFFIAATPIIQHMDFIGFAIGDFYIAVHMFIFFILVIGFGYRYLSDMRMIGTELSTVDKLLILYVISAIPSFFLPYYLPVNHIKRWLVIYGEIFELWTLYFIIRYFLNSIPAYGNKLLLAILLTTVSSGMIAYMELSGFGFSIGAIALKRMGFGFGYHNPNLFGIQAVLVIPLALYSVYAEEFAQYRRIFLLCFIVLLFISFITLTRGLIAVILFQLLLSFFFISKSRGIVAFLLAVFVIFAVVVFPEFLELAMSRFFSAGTGGAEKIIDQSAAYRFVAWEVGAQLLWLFPFGIGAGSFQYAWEIYGSDPTFFIGAPHHLFLSISVDHGILALLFFSGVLIMSIIKLRTIAIASETQKGMAYTLIISLLGYIIYGSTTGGELCHLTGFSIPCNGFSMILFALVAYINSMQISSQRK